MNFFQHWKNKMNRRKTFVQMFIYLIISCLVILTMSTVYFYTMASRSIVKEIGSHAEDTLQKTANSISYMIDWSLLTTQQWSRDSKLVAYAYSQHSDPYDEYIVWSALRKIVLNDPLIDSIYMVNGYSNTIIDTRSGVYQSNDFYDQDALTYLHSDQILNKNTLNARNVNGLLNNIKPFEANVLTYYFPYEPNQSTSTLIVNFDENSILELIGRDFSKIESNYLLINDAQQIVASNYPDQFLQPFTYDKRHFSSQQESGWTQLKIDNKQMLLSYANLTVVGHEHWKIVYTVPIEHLIEGVSHFRNITLLFYIPLFFITLILVWIIARKLYNPISKLMTELNLDKAWKHEQEFDNELSVVSQLYFEQQSNLSRLSETWKNYQDEAKNHLLKDLILNQQNLPPTILQRKLEEVDLHISTQQQVQLIEIEIDQYDNWSSRYPENEIKLLTFAILNIVEETFTFERGYAISLSKHQFGVIISAIGHKDDLFTKLTQCQNAIFQYLSVHVSITSSTSLNNIYELPVAHEAVHASFELKFFEGLGLIQVLDHKEEHAAIFSYQYPDEIERKLINSLKIGHLQDTEHYMEGFFQTLSISSVSEAQLSLTRLTLTIGKTFQQNYSNMKQWNIRFIQENIHSLETITNYKQWLHQQLSSYIEQLKSASLRTNRNKQLVDQVKYLIESYLGDQNLSTKWIADQLQLSTNYLRTVYKDETGQSLADSITAKRLEKIALLLVNTNRTVEDISLNNGFSAINSFYVSFKKQYGMTPAQYRKQYIMPEIQRT
ncbi:helix-turn-helix transcriptional regulator [Paenibacillus sp. CMAA1364]